MYEGYSQLEGRPQGLSGEIALEKAGYIQLQLALMTKGCRNIRLLQK